MKNIACGLLLNIFVLFSALSYASPVVTWDGLFLIEQEQGTKYEITTTLFYNTESYFLSGFSVISDYDGIYLTNPSGLIGYSYRFVEMEQGDLIDAAGIWSRPAFDSNFGPDYGHTVDVYLTTDIPFYFGIQLSHEDAESNMFPFYAWMELVWDGTDLNMLSNAAELTGVGIYCGTGIAIPEPGTMGLILLGGVGLFINRRRFRR